MQLLKIKPVRNVFLAVALFHLPESIHGCKWNGHTIHTLYDRIFDRLRIRDPTTAFEQAYDYIIYDSH